MQVTIGFPKNLPARLRGMQRRSMGYTFYGTAFEFPGLFLIRRFQFLAVNGFFLPMGIEMAKQIHQAKHQQGRDRDTDQ